MLNHIMDNALKDHPLFPRRNAARVLSAEETAAADKYCRMREDHEAET
jgi:hypothetical protein